MDKNEIAQLAEVLRTLYVKPAYAQAVAQLNPLATGRDYAIGGVPLWKADGTLDQEPWNTITEPFSFEGVPFKVHIFRPIGLIACGPKQVAFALLRLSPPEAAKREPVSLGVECVRMISSEEFLELRLDVMMLLNVRLFPDNTYFFFPILEVWGLLPQFHHDLVVPYLSAKMLLA
jgi:hypothetical protein